MLTEDRTDRRLC